MNTVLWLMYAADVSSSLAITFGLFATILTIVWAVKWVGQWVEDENKPPSRPFIYIVMALFIVAAMLPSKSTIYAVAAVQAGNSFATTERGEKVLKALDTWLDKQSKQ